MRESPRRMTDSVRCVYSSCCYQCVLLNGLGQCWEAIRDRKCWRPPSRCTQNLCFFLVFRRLGQQTQLCWENKTWNEKIFGGKKSFLHRSSPAMTCYCFSRSLVYFFFFFHFLVVGRYKLSVLGANCSAARGETKKDLTCSQMRIIWPAATDGCKVRMGYSMRVFVCVCEVSCRESVLWDILRNGHVKPTGAWILFFSLQF